MSKSQIDPPMVPPMRGEEILLPLRFGEGWGGVFRIYAHWSIVRTENFNFSKYYWWKYDVN